MIHTDQLRPKQSIQCVVTMQKLNTPDPIGLMKLIKVFAVADRDWFAMPMKSQAVSIGIG